MKRASMFPAALLSLCLLPLQGCDTEDEDPVPLPDIYNPVPPLGKAIVFRAESVVDPLTRSDSGLVALTAAVYVDQVSQLMIGGDYVRASSAAASTTLNPDRNRPGAFSGKLNDMATTKQVEMELDYDPMRAASGRWFSSPGLLMNPGAGEYVGTRATIGFPPALLITAPLYDQRVDYLYEDITLTWQQPLEPASPDDHIRLGWNHNCSGFRDDYRRGVIELPAASAASGQYVFQLRNFLISDPAVDAVTSLFVNLAFLPIVAFTGELIEVSEPVTGTCYVYVTLYNDRMHSIPAGFDGGEVVGSRTDTIRLRYVR